MEETEKLFPGPTLLLAGPGFGKTETLAKAIKWLVDKAKVDSEEVMVVTFTNEATINMRNRISNPSEKNVLWIPLDKQPRRISTMHSYGRSVIAEDLETVKLQDNFRVIASGKLRKVLVGDAAQLIKLKRICAEQTASCRQKGSCNYKKNEDKCKICRVYTDLLRKCNAIDYDDQIMLACKIFQERTKKLEEHRKKIKYLLVDEYQDINPAQHELIRLLTDGAEKGFFAVGDDTQSIYGWRGGNPEYIRKFDSIYGTDAKIIKKSISYRCPRHILEGALDVVKKFDPESLEKPIEEYKNKSDSKIVFFDVPSQAKEAQIIGNLIRDVINFYSVLVLVPNRNFAGPIKAVLRKLNINYDCRSNIDSSGLKVIDVLREWIEDVSDNFAFRECVQMIVEGGNVNIPSTLVKTKAKKQEREEKLAKISQMWKLAFSERISLFDAFKKMSTTVPLIKQIVDCLQDIIKAKDKTPQLFLETVSKILRPWPNVDNLLMEINECVEELISSQGVGSGNCVRILTMQGAKGLQADYVFVVGADEGVIPRKDTSEDSIKEMSRLLFVSMTRAVKELYIFHSRTRTSNITYLPASYALKRSRFIDSISKDHINYIYKK